ncbi:hypothetical protein PXJ20_32120 [Paraburkholderia sp. A1RI_3L]|uniref:hypothetical protein n=1 Tax=Paraburkholderia TaxID=1822464 RepID=UPI003B7982B5
MRLLIFSAKLPVGRLALDVEDIRRFTAPDLRSPHLALVRAMIRSGPVRFAQTAVLIEPHPRMPPEVHALMARFPEIFRQHPHAHLALARDESPPSASRRRS